MLLAGRILCCCCSWGKRGESHLHPLPQSGRPHAALAVLAQGTGRIGLRALVLSGRNSALPPSCPSRAGCPFHPPMGYPLPPTGGGDQLVFGLRKVSAFHLSEPRALCLPFGFCQDRLQLEARRWGSSLPPPHFFFNLRGKDSLTRVFSPSLSGTPTRTRRAHFSASRGSHVCPACLIRLRCIWVISPVLEAGSCCRARLPRCRVSRFGGVFYDGYVVGKAYM